MITVMGLVHRNEFIVTSAPDAHVMLWLLHGNDIVINTYEIQQIHVTFYLVSTYK